MANFWRDVVPEPCKLCCCQHFTLRHFHCKQFCMFVICNSKLVKSKIILAVIRIRINVIINYQWYVHIILCFDHFLAEIAPNFFRSLMDSCKSRRDCDLSDIPTYDHLSRPSNLDRRALRFVPDCCTLLLFLDCLCIHARINGGANS